MDILYLFFMGASVGSFLGLVVDRFPQKSIIWPGSHCASCQHLLGVLDLVPVLSALFSRFRCRYCGQAFSAVYSLLEVCCGLLFVWGWLGWLSWGQVAMLAGALVLGLYDIRQHQYPLILIILLGAGLLCFFPFKTVSLILVLIGILCERFSLGFGAGDAYFLAVLSLLISLYQLIWVLQLASLLGICYLLCCNKKRPLAFIPFMTLAYLLTLIFQLG